MNLFNKTILLISPQEWNGLRVSKHHYAEELAKRGNRVFFLEPPGYKSGNVEVRPSGIDNLFIVRYNFLFGPKIRFHFRRLYDFLASIYIKRIRKKLGNLDVVWCFEPNLYSNLTLFKSELSIFHPVDAIDLEHQISVGKSADIIFSISNNILEKFRHINVPRFFINHGLSSHFMQEIVYKSDKNLRFAYIGNLSMKGIDQDSLYQVVTGFTNVSFHLYGNYKEKDNLVVSLLKQPNVEFLGRKSPMELATLLKKYSGFMLCYNPSLELNGGSNSHKILEYLSFGKVIVANKVLHYEQHRDLIQMSKFDDNSDYVHLFEETVKNLERYNTSQLIKMRRKLARVISL